jgi:hypothetical protein
MIRDKMPFDAEILREIHREAGYGFEFPDMQQMNVVKVITNPEERVVGMVGAQLEAQIFGIFDPKAGTPGERMMLFRELHRPIAEELAKLGAKEAYVALDPKFPAFGRRLMSLGWKKALWTQYFLPVHDCLGRFRQQGAA